MPVVRSCLLAQCWQLYSCRRLMAVMRKMYWTHGLGSSRVVCDGRGVMQLSAGGACLITRSSGEGLYAWMSRWWVLARWGRRSRRT